MNTAPSYFNRTVPETITLKIKTTNIQKYWTSDQDIAFQKV